MAPNALLGKWKEVQARSGVMELEFSSDQTFVMHKSGGSLAGVWKEESGRIKTEMQLHGANVIGFIQIEGTYLSWEMVGETFKFRKEP